MIITVFAVAMCVILLIVIICLLVWWKKETSSSAIKIPFHSFLDWYSINPDAYEYKYDSDPCLHDHRIRFSFIDFLKWEMWKNQRSKDRERKYVNSEYQSLLQSVQKDIDKARATSDHEMKCSYDDYARMLSQWEFPKGTSFTSEKMKQIFNLKENKHENQ